MKRALKYAIPVAAIIAQGIDEPATAGDVFLKVDGIKGESVDAKHPDEIDVLAWSWGVSIPIDVSSGGGGGGSANSSFTPIKVIKSVDSASPQLIGLAATGGNVPSAILTATRATSNGEEEFMKLTLQGVYVSKVAQGGKDGEDGVAETITLEYTEINVEYRPWDSKTGFGSWQNTCWDRLSNKSC